ncbi:MAG: hypothetical protein J2P30_20060 [Actinobacteria bacterium]|nr:hypothetical protein [Actinomycetota bacterium]
MTGIWRGTSGQLLALYVILGLAAAGFCALAQVPLPENAQPLVFPVAAFLAWRVSRGGRVSRVILLIVTALSFGGAAFMQARSWSPLVFGLLAIYGAQFLLLVSPAVYQRTRPGAVPGQAPAGQRRWRPPLWLPLSALLVGLVVTLLYLGNMGFQAVPGCGPAGATMAELPARCITLAEGYPVRFLTAYQSIPEIGTTSLTVDWGQWSLVSFTVLYLAWFLEVRPVPPRPQPVVSEEPPAA